MDEGDERPREQPHRGPVLAILGAVSAICGLLSPSLVFPAVVALPLGLTVWVLSASDLKRLDPASKELLDLAWFFAVAGVALGLLGVLLWGVYLLGILPRPGTGCGCSGVGG